MIESVCIGPVHNKHAMSQDEILDEIYWRRINGLAIVSITLPLPLRPVHDHFPAIFKRAKIKREQTPQFMQDYCERNNLKLPSQPMLVSSFFCENQLLDLEYVAFLMHLGYEVTWVERVYQFATARPFSDFIRDRAAARADAVQQGDVLQADLCKLQVNSSVFGQSILRADRYKTTRFVSNEDFERYYMNNRNLVDLLPVYDGTGEKEVFWEVSLRPRVVTRKNPITIGLKILMAAKVHLLKFVLEYLPEFLGDRNFECMVSFFSLGGG